MSKWCDRVGDRVLGIFLSADTAHYAYAFVSGWHILELVQVYSVFYVHYIRKG